MSWFSPQILIPLDLVQFQDQLVSIVLATLKNLPILIKKDVLDEVRLWRWALIEH
jgi:hypothetical protein